MSTLNAWLVSFCWDSKQGVVESIGLDERYYVRKRKVVWALKHFIIFTLQRWHVMHNDDLLILQCLETMYFTMRIFLRYSIGYFTIVSKQPFSMMLMHLFYTTRWVLVRASRITVSCLSKLKLQTLLCCQWKKMKHMIFWEPSNEYHKWAWMETFLSLML